MRLRNKIAVVTGGGGRGIGKAICILFAKEGASVVAIDRDGAGARATATEIVSAGGDAVGLQAELSREAEVDKAISVTLSRYEHIDILVNNAGSGQATGPRILQTPESDLKISHSINLKSAFLCTRAVLPSMLENGNGSIVFVSTANVLLGGFSETVYAAAKSGLHSMAQSLTADYSPNGIRFNVVLPGTVPLTSSTWRERERQTPGTFDNLARLYPLRRFGEAEDVARAVLFLSSDEASWITGVVLPVDGGITATGALPGGEWWKYRWQKFEDDPRAANPSPTVSGQ